MPQKTSKLLKSGMWHVTFSADLLDEVSAWIHAGPRCLAWPGKPLEASGGFPDSPTQGAHTSSLVFPSPRPTGPEEFQGISHVLWVIVLEEEALQVGHGMAESVVFSPWWRGNP